jgi:hypothetical protein
MALRNLIRLIFILPLGSVFFVASLTAMVCFCGRCFPASMQDINLKISSTVDKSSPGNSYKSCNFVKGKSLKGIPLTKQADKLKIFSKFIHSDFHDYSFTRQFKSSMRPFSHSGIIYASSIFLKNLSIRC